MARRLPAVVVDQPVGTGLPTVAIADEAAAAEAARHLTARGHTRFAVVAFGLGPGVRSGPAGLARRRDAAYAVSRARLAGYAAALEAAGIAWAGVPVHECAGSDRAAGRAAAARLLAAAAPPTAILATSDVLAFGVLDAAAAAGVTVPGDLAVVGFDDVPAAAAAGLTTVRQDHHAKGRLAGDLLLAALRGERPRAPGAAPARAGRAGQQRLIALNVATRAVRPIDRPACARSATRAARSRRRESGRCRRRGARPAARPRARSR